MILWGISLLDGNSPRNLIWQHLYLCKAPITLRCLKQYVLSAQANSPRDVATNSPGGLVHSLKPEKCSFFLPSPNCISYIATTAADRLQEMSGHQLLGANQITQPHIQL